VAVNRGKQFEQVIKDGFSDMPDVSIDRLRDPVGGQLGIRNICDFIVYQYPNQFYIECKAIHGNTLNFVAHVSEYQWNGLLEKSKIPGAFAGIIVWYIDHDITIFITIDELEKLKMTGSKSLNINQVFDNYVVEETQILLISGKKKRIFFEYNLRSLLLSLKVMKKEWWDKDGKE